ncbi:sigma factor-like helix-turn-helix DNA-binding protein [Actinoplanes sp. NPDC049596]|uniref:RNA polymerase sigma factor n=1 Tax=unclassified Actinoplanes TaxID=2626549 RepID=UPI00341E38B8
MTHSGAKNRARTRALYTGENFQLAQAAIRTLPPKMSALPSAGTEDQQRLESALMVALCRPGVEAFLPVAAVHPLPQGLELTVPPRHLPEFCRRVLPLPGGSPFAVSGLLALAADRRVLLRRPGQDASIVIRACGKPRWDSTVAAIMKFDKTIHVVASPTLAERWHRTSADADPESAWIGSQLLRRIGLFQEPAAAAWVTQWQAHRVTVEWLAAEAPEPLASALLAPAFGLEFPTDGPVANVAVPRRVTRRSDASGRGTYEAEFNHFYAASFQTILRMLMIEFPEGDIAETAAAKAFADVWRRRDSLAERGNAWHRVLKAGRRKAFGLRARRHREEELTRLDRTYDVTRRFAGPGQRVVAEQTLQSFLQQLPRRQAEVCALLADEYTVDEIAKVLECSVRSVRENRRVIRQKFSSYWDE